jgi:hypothetical protein
MKPEAVLLFPEDRLRIRDALKSQAAHLRDLAKDDGPHVPGRTRAEWRQEAEACSELAQRVQQAEDTTTFRSGK